MIQKEHKLDVFRVLNHIDRKDADFYNNLSEEERKGFLPIIVMKWLSGTSDAGQIYTLNEVVNPYAFSLHKHKELLYQLMTVVPSDKKTKRYFWNKTLLKKNNTEEALDIIKEFYGYNTTQACEALKLLSNDDVLECAKQLGKQKDELSKLQKILKKNER